MMKEADARRLFRFCFCIGCVLQMMGSDSFQAQVTTSHVHHNVALSSPAALHLVVQAWQVVTSAPAGRHPFTRTQEISNGRFFQGPKTPHNKCAAKALSSNVDLSSTQEDSTYSMVEYIMSEEAKERLRRQDASQSTSTAVNEAMDSMLYPESERRYRLEVGSIAQGLHHSQATAGKALKLHDDCMGLTYAEFPPESFHLLVNRAKQYVIVGDEEDDKKDTITRQPAQSTTQPPPFNPYASVADIAGGTSRSNISNNNMQSSNKGNVNTIKYDKHKKKLIDLGSGTGRLVMYGALAQAAESTSDFKGNHDDDDSVLWDIHGIEIAQELHAVGVQLLDRAVAEGFMHPAAPVSSSTDNIIGASHNMKHQPQPKVCLHQGSAELCASKGVFDDADIVFCYSTVLPSSGFSVECEAMLIGREWSELLARACPEGCIAVMTDRILDPAYGWVLLERMEVENPELLGSMGYIQRLQKSSAMPPPPPPSPHVSF
jgi:hypothetical protein